MGYSVTEDSYVQSCDNLIEFLMMNFNKISLCAIELYGLNFVQKFFFSLSLELQVQHFLQDFFSSFHITVLHCYQSLLSGYTCTQSCIWAKKKN